MMILGKGAARAFAALFRIEPQRLGCARALLECGLAKQLHALTAERCQELRVLALQCCLSATQRGFAVSFFFIIRVSTTGAIFAASTLGVWRKRS